MRHILFLFLAVFSFNAFCEEDPEADRTRACTEALNSAETAIQNKITTLANQLQAAPPQAVDAASGTALTGNPITDNLNGLAQARSQLGQAQQQKQQAQAQVDNECFQQFENLADKSQELRQKEPERLMQINLAEGEKAKRDAEIRTQCQNEASALYQKEVERLMNYSQRTVSTLSGATNSRKELANARPRFYAQCMNSPVTQEALNSNRADLDIKMRNLGLLATQYAADLEYYENTKMARLSANCELRQSQIDSQFSTVRNTAIQQMALSFIGLQMASSTASASSDNQQQVSATYGSLAQVMSVWPNIAQRCANLHTSSSASDLIVVPSDAAYAMREIHNACRAPGTDANVLCFRSSSTQSTEQQRVNRATSSQ